MSKTAPYRKFFYLIALLSTAFLLFFYGEVLLAPNDYFFEAFGDGINQYYSFSYYVKHNQAWLENDGINYPYHEHYVYSDGQLLLAAITRIFSTIFPAIDNYTVGVFNLMLLFSIWLTPLLLYGIMARIKIQPLLAVLAALGITALNPQLARFYGHFSLTYSFIIPLVLYLILLVESTKRAALWAVLLAGFNLSCFFIHAYLGLIVVALTASCWFFFMLFNFAENTKNWRAYIFPVLTVLLPVLAFKSFMDLTDLHTAKSKAIYGFFVFCGEPDDVFLPNKPPFKDFFEKNFALQHNWEGTAYVGMTTNFTLLIGLFFLCRNWLLKRIKKVKFPPFDQRMKIAFWAAIPLLLLSWAFPFKQMPFLLDYFESLKNFRAIGRFAWAFYYVATIFSVYLIHRAIVSLLKKEYRILAYLLLFIAPSFYFIEGLSQQIEISHKIKQEPNRFSKRHSFKVIENVLPEINAADYQAILPLPLYYYGSGNFHRPLLGGTMHFSKCLSIQTGLPIIGGATARGDVWESRNIVQMISPPYYTKMMEKDLKSDKSFLIARSHPGESLTRYEQQIIEKATWIGGDKKDYAIYSISKAALFDLEVEQTIQNFEQQRDSLYLLENGWLSNDSTAFIYYDDFENQLSDTAHMGRGAFHAPKEQNHLIATAQPPAGKTCQLSFWMFNGKIDAMNYAHFKIVWLDKSRNEKKILNAMRYDDAFVIDQNWSMLELPFKLPPDYQPQEDEIQVHHSKSNLTAGTLFIDDLLIIEQNVPSYKIVKSENGKVKELIYNGHWIRNDKE